MRFCQLENYNNKAASFIAHNEDFMTLNYLKFQILLVTAHQLEQSEFTVVNKHKIL
jgi:hypothetical protein